MGLPIGSVISGLLAEFYLFDIYRTLTKWVNIRGGDLLKYVDDFVVLLPKRVEVDSLLMFFNSQDEDIQFVVEGNGNVVQFLDMCLKLQQNELVTSWFRKDQIGMSYLNFNSNVPYNVKVATVRNTVKAIGNINNTLEGKQCDLNLFDRILTHNGYPRKFIDADVFVK